MKRRNFFKTTLAGSAVFMFPMNNLIFSRDLIKDPARNNLQFRFLHPTENAKPHTWWHWMNGNITPEGIDLDLQAMHEIGLGGFQLFDVECGIPQGSVRYGSENWHELVKHSISKAESLGMKMCFHNCPGWSSSGGPWITPETSMKKVVWTEKQLTRDANDHSPIRLEQPETIQNFYRDIAVMAFPAPESEKNGSQGFRLEDWRTKGAHLYTGRMIAYKRNKRPGHDSRDIAKEELIPKGEVIDLTNMMNPDGSLTWSAPDGLWNVVRFGYTITGKTNHPAPPEGVGLECDKLSKEGAETHWNGIVEKVIKTAGEMAGSTFDSVLIDSYEAHAQNWTHNFESEFRKRRGYEMRSFFPCLTGRVVDSIEISERFLWDFRRTVADLFADYYYGHFSKLCEQNNLKLYVQPYGRIGNFDEISNSVKGHIPMGEFWVNQYDFGMAYSSKLAASAAHVKGTKIVASETFTAGRKEAAWISHPFSLKALGDYFYCKGINKFVFHEFAHQPWPDIKPGMTMGPFGFQMNRGNTWWKQGGQWITYLTRTQQLLQEGQFVADICYYFGENVPNTLDNKDQLSPTPPDGYDYDCIETDSLMSFNVRNGELLLPSGMRYKILVLPHFERSLRPEIIEKIKQLVTNGATVLGPKPIYSPGLTNYPDCDQQVQKMSSELWGDTNGEDKTSNRKGKGSIYWGVEIKDILDESGILPDFIYNGLNNPGIEYIHRRTEEEEIYFISNQEHQAVAVECSFRHTGSRPEIWNPETGKIIQTAHYRFSEQQTHLPLTMEPAGSLFVIFRKEISDQLFATEARYNNQSINAILSKKTSPELRILEAKYGILTEPSKTLDVKEMLSDRIRSNYLKIIPGRIITDDPAPEESKQLYIRYEIGGKEYFNTIAQGAQLILPDQPAVHTFPAAELTTDNANIVLQAWTKGRYAFKFNDGTEKKIRVKALPKPTTIDGSWELHFPAGMGAPEKTVLEELISWTEHPDTGIKYFSGTATYRKTIKISKDAINSNHKIWLDLGKVYNIAEVFLNGQKLETLWKPPFRTEITDLVKPGTNRLEIHITNLWPNRMIGDENKPDPRPFEWNQRWRALLPVNWEQWQEFINNEITQPGYFAKKSERYAFTTARFYSADDPLLDSGLIGPVAIYSQKIIII